MDPPANHHQSPSDLDWFNYVDNIDQEDQPLFRDDYMSLEVLDQKISPLEPNHQSINPEYGFQDSEALEDISSWDSCTYSTSGDHLGFQDLDLIEDLSLWDCWDDEDSSECRGGVKCTSGAATADHRGRKVAKRSRTLELEEIEKYFAMPIVVAAKELRIGLTVLKKRCRELDIKRWPHRKLKSLQTLIQNVKELGLKEEIEMLEGHKRMMEKLPDMNITERTKKLRQACFKANYKKRRLNSPP